MNYRMPLILIGCFPILLWSCEKAENDLEKDIVGIWDVTSLTYVEYDSLGNVIDTDTVLYTDSYGEPVSVSEQYTTDRKFFFLQGPEKDTLVASTYTLQGSSLKINTEDSLFSINNRTITKLDQSSLEESWVKDYSTIKLIFTQKYRRQ